MGECEFIEDCPFFNDLLAAEPAAVDQLKKKYCRTNNLNCARYMLVMSVGREHLPADLNPLEKERAYLIIAELG